MSRKRTAILGALLTALAPISMSIYTPAMPELTRVFATNEAAIKLSLSLYFAGFAVAQLLAGPASDAFGRKSASLAFLSIFWLVGCWRSFLRRSRCCSLPGSFRASALP